MEERNQLLQQVGMLTGAIEAHRSAMADLEPDDVDVADEELWAALDGGPTRATARDEVGEP